MLLLHQLEGVIFYFFFYFLFFLSRSCVRAGLAKIQIHTKLKNAGHILLLLLRLGVWHVQEHFTSMCSR